MLQDPEVGDSGYFKFKGDRLKMIKKLTLVAVFIFVANFVAFAGVLDFIPEDTALVVNVNFGKLLATEAIKKQVEENMAKQTPDQKKAFDDFVAKTGIDPLKSLKEVIIFVSGKSDAKNDKPKGGVIVTGNFDVPKILKAIKEDPNASKDTIIDKFEGLDAVKGKKEQDSMGVFLDGSTALIGNNDVVKLVVDVKNGKAKGLSTNASFGNVLKKADVAASIWGVGLIPQALKDQAKANPQAAPLAAINALFFSFNYDPDLSFNFTGEVDKKENVDQVMTSLNGFLAMIKMMAAQSPEAAEVLNMIKVEAVDTAAKITLNVSKAKLDEIKKKIEEKMKNPPAQPAPEKK